MPRTSKSMPSSVRLRSITLCDQVRIEDNGKRLLIGCYDGGVAFNTVPSIFSAFMYGGFDILSKEIREIHFRAKGPGFAGRGHAVVDSSPDAIPMIGFLIPIVFFVQSPSKLYFDWHVGDEKWSKPIEWSLDIADGATKLDEHTMNRTREIFSASTALLAEQLKSSQEAGAN
jgi:hypothetical protein